MSHSNNIMTKECQLEESLLKYCKKASEVITFHIVRNIRDIEERNGPRKKLTSYHPLMAHQIFGDSETIFGYKHLNIDLYYLHNSARCYLSIQHSGEFKDPDANCKPDDIEGTIKPWIPEDYETDKEKFLTYFNDEPNNRIFGELIDEFKNETTIEGKTIQNNYKVTFCDICDEAFKEFHSRFETLIIWIIDGANFIDLDDPRWLFFYIYEESEDDVSKEKISSPVGYCTAYKFWSYPDAARPRISQFFILPTHQRRGLGTKLYNTIFKYLKNMPNVTNITIEEPTKEMQRLRDFCDCVTIYDYVKEQNLNCLYNPSKLQDIIKEQKICKKQSQRIIDIISALNALKSGKEEYNKVLEQIKNRMIKENERNRRGSKRLCPADRTALIKESEIKEYVDIEYKKYIESIEATLNRLKTHLSL